MLVNQTCRLCSQAQMVDLSQLSRQVSNLLILEGYQCLNCGTWNTIWRTNVSLNEKMERLSTMKPETDSFRYHFAKALKRAEELQKRG